MQKTLYTIATLVLSTALASAVERPVGSISPSPVILAQADNPNPAEPKDGPETEDEDTKPSPPGEKAEDDDDDDKDDDDDDKDDDDDDDDDDDKDDDDKKKKDKKPEPNPLSFYSTSTVLYDTNINHNQTYQSSFARIFGLGTVYRRSAKPYDFEINYEINHHEHTVNRWDRFSHYLSATVERPISKKWDFETVAEMNLKGSIDDADLSDEYILMPRLAYNINKQNRLRFFTAYRLRRYPEDELRNAINRYAGIQYRRKFKGDRALEFGYRYEINNSEGPRNDYLRWTYDVEFTTPISRRDNLQLEAKFRPKNYDTREVEVDDDDVLRRDSTWMLTANWRHALTKHRELNFYYKYETLSSNDEDKPFNSHLFAISLVQHW